MKIDMEGICRCPVMTGGTVIHSGNCPLLTRVSSEPKKLSIVTERKPRYVKLWFDTGTGEIDVPKGWKLHQVIAEAEIDTALWCVIKDANFD
jgi:hypothetical protein